MPHINHPSSLPCRYLSTSSGNSCSYLLWTEKAPRTRASRATAVAVWPTSVLLDMCSIVHLSVVQFSCFGSRWIIRHNMFRGVSGLFYWVIIGFLADGTPGAWVRRLLMDYALHPHLDWVFFILSSTADLPVLCVFSQTQQHPWTFCLLGKQGLAHLNRCHVLVICNHARGPNLLLSFLFFGRGVDKCWRGLSAGQPLI